jgi:pimeloyl-ACP methyl ester carboxylesterase
MQLVMFSGNSLRNRDWIYEARQHFADLFDDLYVQDYRHWEIGGDWIDLAHELEALQAKAAGFDAKYGVFAKSIGTVLAVQALAQGIIKPDWVLFCGIPFGYVDRLYPQFAVELAKCRLPTTIIHNEHDTVGDADAVDAYLKVAFAGRKDYRFIKTPGETHDYEDYELLRAQLTALRG